MFMRLVHQRLCRELLNRKITLRTVRELSVHPASFGYTGGLPLSKERTVRRRSADSPPVLGRIYQRQFQSVGSVKNSKADGPPGYRGQSATGQKGGVGQT